MLEQQELFVAAYWTSIASCVTMGISLIASTFGLAPQFRPPFAKEYHPQKRVVELEFLSVFCTIATMILASVPAKATTELSREATPGPFSFTTIGLFELSSLIVFCITVRDLFRVRSGSRRSRKPAKSQRERRPRESIKLRNRTREPPEPGGKVSKTVFNPPLPTEMQGIAASSQAPRADPALGSGSLSFHDELTPTPRGQEKLDSLNLLTTTIADLRELLSDDALRIGSVHLVQKYYKHIDLYNTYFRAVTDNMGLQEEARAEAHRRARQLDTDHARGLPLGPLHGIPCLVKVSTIDTMRSITGICSVPY